MERLAPGDREDREERQGEAPVRCCRTPPLAHKRIDGGISDPRTPFSPHRRTLARAWTARQGPFRPSICTLRILSEPRGAVYPIAASRRLLSVESVVTGPIFASRHAGRARRWAGRMQPRGVRRQVHRGQDLFGDVLGLDEGDEAQLATTGTIGPRPDELTRT
jgi:hypothetical protein